MFQNKPVIGLTCSFRPDGGNPQHYLNDSYIGTLAVFRC